MKSTSRATSDAGGSSSGQLYTDYSYDSVDRVLTVKQDLVKLAYTYASGNLSLIRRGYDSTVGNCNQDYSFTYNRYGQRLSVSVGDRVLAAYSYDTVSHNLSGMTYGNDTEGVASYQYTYDRLDRMIGKTMPYTGEYFAYVYDYLGNVVEEKYSRFGSEVRTYHFEYDRLGRPVSRYETENGVIVEQKESTFDAKGRDLKYTYVGDDFSYTRDYSYYDETGWLGSVTQDYNGEREITAALSYANLGRVRFRVYGGPYIGRVSYTYQTDSSDPNRIISNMTSMRYTFGGKQTFADYSYDNIGNVKHAEYKYDSIPYTFVDYNYDRYNQLTKEVHSPLSMGIDLRSAEYAYDEFGNITDVTRTDSSGKVTKNRYVYSDKTGWQDLLTSYNGHTITYDEIGNPLSYYNGKNYSFEWEAGRRLHNSASGGNSINYYYNKDGIRTEKSVSGKYTDRYILDGDRVIGMERTKSGSSVKDVYHFIYDEMGNIWEAICYIGGSTTPVRYYYRTNAQGDVKQIVDSNYNVVAYYAYDAWGKLLAVLDGNDNPITDSSHFAIVNPFRYRGYIYDTETGFYYLQSRYYDPEIGRFINADGQLNQQERISGYNLFAYCNNDPINMIDSDGKFPFLAITAAIGAAVGAVVGGIRAAKAGKSVWKGALKGAAIGGLVGLGAGAVAGALLAGSAAASVASVVIGAKATVAMVESAGVVAGAKMLLDNASKALNNTSQVFWSGGDIAKNAAKEVAYEIEGVTLEMTNVGIYLEQIEAKYSAWQAASLNFANVASNSNCLVYSIQNVVGVNIKSIWATIEYPMLKNCDIIFGVAFQDGAIKIMP